MAVVLGILALALARVAAGWAPLAPDDARYLFVGLSVLDGQGAVAPNGEIFLLRSPVFGVALALGSRLVGGDPIDGARIVAVAGATAGLIGCLRVAWLVSGPTGAIGTTIALASTPLIWQLLPSLRIDLPQAALVVLLLLVAWWPTVRRWAMAGVVLGLAVLTKEAVLPLLLLPVALVGSVPRRAALAMAIAYVGAAVATAGWWWIVVWESSAELFPLNALAVIEARDVARSLHASWATGILAVVGAMCWLYVGVRSRTEYGPRLLAVAAVGLAPAALYAASQGLDPRNFVALAVLSSIAVGIGAARLTNGLRDRDFLQRSGLGRAAVSVIALAAIVATVGLGQAAVPRPGDDRLADAIVAWVDEHVPDGGRIVMSFREREAVALRRFGRTAVRSLVVRRVRATDDPASYVWIGLRDAQLFGYTRRSWLVSLTTDPPNAVVLAGPHPFTPMELVGTDGPLALPGLSRVATIEVDAGQAQILRVEPADVARATETVPLHLSADAALAWIDLAAGTGTDDEAITRLVAARPVVSGAAIPTLLRRLGARACAIPGPAGTMRLSPRSTCPA